MRLMRLLLFLQGALQGCLSQSIHVSQIPEVNATKGSTVTLQCNYTLISTEETSIGWYRWYKHVLGGPEVSNDNVHFKDRVSRVTQTDFLSNGLANIQLRDVQLEESGMYICEVEFRLNQSTKGYGNWTFLHVQEFGTLNPENAGDNIVGITFRLLMVLLISFMSVALYLLCIKRGYAPSRELLRHISTRGVRVLRYASRISRMDFREQNNDVLQSTVTEQQTQCPYILDNLQYGCMEMPPQNSFSAMNLEVAEYEVF